jgi:predicted nucleic acid-binding protein
VIIVDTGGLIAAIDRHSRLHREAKALLDKEQRNLSTRLLLSPFVLAEVDYLLTERKNRPDIAMEVLRDVERGAYRLEPFSATDVSQARQVMQRYEDQKIGLADASNVVLAKRHNTLDVLTTDERHFRVLRGKRGRPFRLLPADL